METYRPYDVATFPAISEPPAYFKKEVKPYSEMNYGELERYIRDLQQGGFDVVRLRVQLQKKLAYPSSRWSWRYSRFHLRFQPAGAEPLPASPRRWNCPCLLDSVGTLRSHGKRQPVATGAGRMVAQFDLRPGGRLSHSESADLTSHAFHLTAIAEGCRLSWSDYPFR